MKSYKILILTAALIISNVTACIPDCWAEKLGYPCCKGNDPKVEYTDEHGDWSTEDGQKCGILVWDHSLRCVPSTSDEPNKTENNECKTCRSVVSIDENGTIWSKQISSQEDCIINLDKPICKEEIKNTNWNVLLGYETCKEQHDVIFKDNDGKWSVENEKWCGIQYCPSCTNVESIDKYGNLWSTDDINGNKCIINKDDETCNQELKKECRSALEGYLCCKNTDKVVKIDDFGSWGVENGQWCGFNEKYPCSWYKEKGYKCCNEVYNYYTLREKLSSNYVSQQEKASDDGIFVEVDGEVCGLTNNIYSY